jgi:hypothetical protein
MNMPKESIELGVGAYESCGYCPFSLLCIAGRLVNNGSQAQFFVCPKCGMLCQENGGERYWCPARPLLSATKAAWTAAWNRDNDNAWARGKHRSVVDLDTQISVADPVRGEGFAIPVYLCAACYQDPPTIKRDISIYDLEPGPP